MIARQTDMTCARQSKSRVGGGGCKASDYARYGGGRITVHAGVHASGLSMSRQISPVRHSTFGWKIGVMNTTRGGASG